jgi:hypothetical protein
MNDAAAWASTKFDGLHPSARLILLFAVIVATPELEFFVTREEILKATAFNKRTLYRQFPKLQALGLISRDSRASGERPYWGAARYRAACFEPSAARATQLREVSNVELGVPAC